MMKIGLISDTHSFLDEKVFRYFEDCDEIWHAGDIGERTVLEKLQSFKPVRAVFGNIDDREMQNLLQEDLWFTCEGVEVWMTHIAGAPPRYNPRVNRMLQSKSPRVLICGHSHILRVMKDPNRDMLYINPGAAGNHGFHSMKTIVRFQLEKSQIKNLEVIELGRRGAL